MDWEKINFYKFKNKKGRDKKIMEKDIIYINEQFTSEELKLIKGCLLTTKETLKLILFKNKDIKNKMGQIEKLLNKF